LGDLIVRPARPGEEDVVLDVLAAAACWVRTAGVDQWPERFPTQLIEEGIERGEVFLAIEDGLVVGDPHAAVERSPVLERQ